METDSAPSLADRCTVTLEGMRAEMAAQGTRKGPAQVLARAVLRLLEALVALLAEFKAGTLGAATPGGGAACAAAPDCATVPVDGGALAIPHPRPPAQPPPPLARASWPNPSA